MIPDRRAEIGPHRNPVARLALATFIAVGSSTYVPLLEKLASWFPTTPVAEAFTPDCRTGLGVTVDNKDFSRGARVIVVEDPINGRRIAERRLRVGEEVRVEFTGPSNAKKGDRDARRIVYSATDTDGRIVFPKAETTVTCGSFEHFSSKPEEETQRRETPTPSRTATPTPGLTPSPSATPAPDRIATLEAQLREIRATTTRAAEDEQSAQKVRTEVATEARATVEAERRATETVTRLIKDAREEERRAVLATVTAQAGAITPTVTARGGGASPAGTSPIDNIPGWVLLVAGGLVTALLGGGIWGVRRLLRGGGPPAPPAAPAAAGPAPAAGGGAPGPAGPAVP